MHRCIVLYTKRTYSHAQNIWAEFPEREQAIEFIKDNDLTTDKTATVILLDRPRDRVPVPDFLRDAPQTVPDCGPSL